ncbi:hypothetical protein B0H19DRAFT_1143708 [Mycena capillaripes]|nr:hypothetical protein B0H19DRAFT_1143708 [Mycena capillaripes]
MHAFKFISVSAVFLLALMQCAVAQVPLGGTFKWCQRLFCTSAERTSCIGESKIGLVRILNFMLTYAGSSLAPPRGIQTPCSEGKCCILGPDLGVCMLTCPY